MLFVYSSAHCKKRTSGSPEPYPPGRPVRICVVIIGQHHVPRNGSELSARIWRQNTHAGVICFHMLRTSRKEWTRGARWVHATSARGKVLTILLQLCWRQILIALETLFEAGLLVLIYNPISGAGWRSFINLHKMPYLMVMKVTSDSRRRGNVFYELIIEIRLFRNKCIFKYIARIWSS